MATSVMQAASWASGMPTEVSSSPSSKSLEDTCSPNKLPSKLLQFAGYTMSKAWNAQDAETEVTPSKPKKRKARGGNLIREVPVSRACSFAQFTECVFLPGTQKEAGQGGHGCVRLGCTTQTSKAPTAQNADTDITPSKPKKPKAGGGNLIREVPVLRVWGLSESSARKEGRVQRVQRCNP